jgi:hypothetical protein
MPCTHGEPPAMRLGLDERPQTAPDVLCKRLFHARRGLPARWARYYWKDITSREFAHPTRHRRRYAT